MAGGSNGYRAALVRRQLTPGLISSLPGTAGLPPFISFSTSYPEPRNFGQAQELRDCKRLSRYCPIFLDAALLSRTAKIFPWRD